MTGRPDRSARSALPVHAQHDEKALTFLLPLLVFLSDDFLHRLIGYFTLQPTDDV
jgi:hypothetical protein